MNWYEATHQGTSVVMNTSAYFQPNTSHNYHCFFEWHRWSDEPTDLWFRQDARSSWKCEHIPLGTSMLVRHHCWSIWACMFLCRIFYRCKAEDSPCIFAQSGIYFCPGAEDCPPGFWYLQLWWCNLFLDLCLKTILVWWSSSWEHYFFDSM